MALVPGSQPTPSAVVSAGLTAQTSQAPAVGFGASISALQGITQLLGGIAAKDQADENAKLLRELGILRAQAVRRVGRRLEGRQIAQAGFAGGTMTGSIIDIIADTTVENEREALTQQFSFDAQAQVEEARGTALLVASIARGQSTILGGVSRALGRLPREEDQDDVTTEGK